MRKNTRDAASSRTRVRVGSRGVFKREEGGEEVDEVRQRKRDEAEDEDGKKEEERRQNEVRDALPARGRRGEDAQCWSDGGSGAVAPVGPVPAAAAGGPPRAELLSGFRGRSAAGRR